MAFDLSRNDSRLPRRVREKTIEDTPEVNANFSQQRQIVSFRDEDADPMQAARRELTSNDLDNYNEHMVRRRVTRQKYSDDDRHCSRRGRPSDSSQSNASDLPSAHRRRRSRSHHRRSLDEVERSVGDFFHQNFNHSISGIVAASAGAGVGAFSARYLGSSNPYRPGDKSGLKTLGGAAAGALAFNAAETKWQNYLKDIENGRR